VPTTDGKRKVRPDRRGVDAYGQPVQAVPSPAGGSPHEEAQGAETFENAAQVRGEGGPKTEASWLKRLGSGRWDTFRIYRLKKGRRISMGTVPEDIPTISTYQVLRIAWPSLCR